MRGLLPLLALSAAAFPAAAERRDPFTLEVGAGIVTIGEPQAPQPTRTSTSAGVRLLAGGPLADGIQATALVIGDGTGRAVLGVGGRVFSGLDDWQTRVDVLLVGQALSDLVLRPAVGIRAGVGGAFRLGEGWRAGLDFAGTFVAVNLGYAFEAGAFVLRTW